MERIPTPRWDRNCLRLLLTACMILLLVTVVSIGAFAQGGVLYSDGWEDGNLDDYTVVDTDGEVRVNTTISNGGSNSLELLYPTTESGDVDDLYAETSNSFNIDFDEQFNLTTYARYDVRDGTVAGGDRPVRIEVWDPTGDAIFVHYDRGNSEWALTRNAFGGNVIDPTDTNATSPAPTSFTKVRLHIEPDGTAEVYIDGNLSMTGTYNGFSDTSELTVRFAKTHTNPSSNFDSSTYYDDAELEATGFVSGEEPEQSLSLFVNSWMDHGDTQTYRVILDDDGDRSDVTDQATINSSNTSVITADESNNTITATSDVNVSERVTITANYSATTGIVSTSENVTVANKTMDNWSILPSWSRIEAMFSFDPGSNVDTNMVWIILAVLVGMAFTTIASSFAGIGVTTLIVIIGWFWGQAGGVSTVGTGVMLAALFGGLFIGLNLAANIDYAMTRGGGVEG